MTSSRETSISKTSVSKDARTEKSAEQDPLLRVESLSVTFPAKTGIFAKRGGVQAVSDISLEIARGETLGLVGESGCGKSTTGRAIMQLVKTTRGSIRFNGNELSNSRRRDLRSLRDNFQIV